MLMFLGEYFKKVIDLTTEMVEQKDPSEKTTEKRYQSEFYITYDILNYLGSACKMLLENPRQELRISIGLARSPTFQNQEQLETLKANIFHSQKEIITKCIDIINFVNFFAQMKISVPLKNNQAQPALCIIEALINKIKADYMRYILECLTGDDGLLAQDKAESFNFIQMQKDKIMAKEMALMEIARQGDKDTQLELSREDVLKCTFCSDEKSKNVTLLEFFEHEVHHEYEKAKKHIFNDTFQSQKYKDENG
mmetsp:Transcript_8941/g.15146  ORF Transcript_8941/g.15146 Transcript_8941/m.15146 type:complete len:252 (+) Transcript_8941:314-1069(+)